MKKKKTKGVWLEKSVQNTMGQMLLVNSNGPNAHGSKPKHKTEADKA